MSGAGLPALLVGEAACGEASTKGDVSSFEAIGTGTVASLRLNATQILKPALDALKPVLDTVAATPVGDLLKATDAPAKTAVTTLNGLLGSLLGQGSVVLPTLEPSQTVKDVVNRLEDADLLRINIGNAIAKNTGTAANFTSESLAQGGTIEVLPAFHPRHQGGPRVHRAGPRPERHPVLRRRRQRPVHRDLRRHPEGDQAP